ncbi:MAG: hypothetical protein LBO03_06635 [Acidaminococcales bacterium]|jgi:hypothetical protein|nr:hypothetical protein [Acidaminococcales bacterium]
MRKKLFYGLFFVCAAVFAAGAAVSAESRYIAQKYSFGGNGLLTSPLTVDFGNEPKTLYAEEIAQSGNSRLLLIAFPSGDGGVSVVRLSGSRSYSLYKANLRDNSHEEVIILGLGAVSGRYVRLAEVVILGKDRDGTIRAIAVNGFSPLDVLNAPLQMDGRRGIVLSAGAGRKELRIMWDGVNEEFFTGDRAAVADTTAPAAAATAPDSGKPAIKKDDGVFDE